MLRLCYSAPVVTISLFCVRWSWCGQGQVRWPDYFEDLIWSCADVKLCPNWSARIIWATVVTLRLLHSTGVASHVLLLGILSLCASQRPARLCPRVTCGPFSPLTHLRLTPRWAGLTHMLTYYQTSYSSKCRGIGEVAWQHDLWACESRIKESVIRSTFRYP